MASLSLSLKIQLRSEEIVYCTVSEPGMPHSC